MHTHTRQAKQTKPKTIAISLVTQMIRARSFPMKILNEIGSWHDTMRGSEVERRSAQSETN